MNTAIKTGLAAILVLAIACKKENNTLPSGITDYSSISDVTNNVTGKYPSVLIGTQRWMTKNLDVARYRNGDKIPQVRDSAKWAALTTGAWCWYNNDSATGAVYGKLYNWYAVHDPRGLAPVGWHVPSDAEWDTLSVHLGGNAGGKMKETGTTHWLAPNTDATNSSGFTALPGGTRDRSFYFLNGYGFWWSSTKYNTYNAWYRALYYFDGFFGRFDFDKHAGFSVRCIKD